MDTRNYHRLLPLRLGVVLGGGDTMDNVKWKCPGCHLEREHGKGEDMKFEVKNRWTGSVQVTAEIECKEHTDYSVKLGLAVKWAVEHSADLRGAKLTGAKLTGANLTSANLAGADLAESKLTGANLTGADLAGADLVEAKLTGADLAGADLAGADLTGADLAEADLAEADLRGANLTGVDLLIFQAGRYTAYVGPESTRIGCEFHPNSEWRVFDNRQIKGMASDALAWWTANKSIIFAMMDQLEDTA